MMFRKCLLAGLTLMLAIVALPQIGAAQRIVVRPYAVYGYGWGPAWYSPYYYPRPHIYAVAPRHGDVKIETHLKDASVYVDGGFAGLTPKLKKFDLQPGNHDVEVRNSAGQTLFHDRVHVLEGKTVEIKL
jgi:PEGA domain